MLVQILKNETMLFYILAGELFLLFLAQLRTNYLLRCTWRMRSQKKEQLKNIRQEVKNGPSEIPVVKFEKTRVKAAEEKKPEKEKKGNYDPAELAILQEMMAEFFG